MRAKEPVEDRERVIGMTQKQKEAARKTALKRAYDKGFSDGIIEGQRMAQERMDERVEGLRTRVQNDIVGFFDLLQLLTEGVSR